MKQQTSKIHTTNVCKWDIHVWFPQNGFAVVRPPGHHATHSSPLWVHRLTHIRMHVHTHKPRARRSLRSLWEDFWEIIHMSEHTWESKRMFNYLNARVCNCVLCAGMLVHTACTSNRKACTHTSCLCLISRREVNTVHSSETFCVCMGVCVWNYFL